ncbi:MAG: permease-like cell division protein FtsX [Methylococcaceae bacterium]
MPRKPARRNVRRHSPKASASPFSGLAAFDKFRNQLALQASLLSTSLSRLSLAPLASSMTVLVIAIAIALPASFHVLLKNIRTASGGLKAGYQVSVFLKPDVSNEAGSRLAEKLEQQALILDARYTTKEEGLRELQSYSGFGDALNTLKFNPLPGVIGLTPAQTVSTTEAMENLTHSLGKLPEVDFVQIDTQWVRKLSALLAIAERGIWGFSVLLGIGVVFSVGNTIRLELENRHEEIAVSQLLGATDGFIRRPFLYSGFWYAIFGGSSAWVLVNSLVLLLKGPARELADLYGSPFTLSFLSVGESNFINGISVALGVGASYVVVAYQLKKLEPE